MHRKAVGPIACGGGGSGEGEANWEGRPGAPRGRMSPNGDKARWAFWRQKRGRNIVRNS